MLRLVSEGVDLEVGSDVSIRMLFKSPLFTLNQIAVTRSLPFTILSSKINDPILKYQNRISTTLRNINTSPNEIPLSIFWDEHCLCIGTLYINSFKDGKYSVNFVETPILDFNKNLADCSFYLFGYLFADLDAMLDKFEEIATSTDLDNPDIPFYVFPVYDEKFAWVSEEDPGYPWINMWRISTQEFVGRDYRDAQQFVIFPRLYNILKEIFTRNTRAVVEVLPGVGSTTYNFVEPIKVIDNFFNKYPNWMRACLFNTFAIIPDGLGQYNVDPVNHLPQMKVLDFLLHVQNYLNIRFIFNNRNRTVEIVQMQDVLEGSSIVDFDKDVESYYEKTVDIEFNGFMLKQNPDELDVYMAAELEAYLPLLFTEYSQSGTKTETVDTDFSYLLDGQGDFNPGGSADIGYVPKCEQNKADWAANKPRIIFYAGMTQLGGGDYYPMGTNIYNADFAAIIDGSNTDVGIFPKYHKKYFQWLLYKKQPYVFRKKITVEDLLNFDFKQIRRIKGLNVLVDEIDVTLKKQSITPANVSCFTV